ncbi:LacI family DNA-binding transcriptional regulator [Streptomyces sp. CMB-StM0423]|uniref:LacI family DNA-binding transcriptional regulator n=1 Tax=Streptomyces sp. CMB-StM0423 TaxID=2059884 RepID=UPI000C706C5B|nr:LacI family DNA-binding transcriptional regulator [Streptomyces sp. CMB-StM0423]AUH41458.1 LacI family transcriptional regulator [Streptomyces sp. CMB-StM0423]
MSQQRPGDAGAPTMRDVANRAGVSTMTVSRVLKEDARVSEETRRRVLAAVDALGYRLNATARSLRLGGSGMIGLIVTNLANPFYSRLALGVQEVASQHGLSMLLSNTGEQLDRERGLVEDLASRQVAGMIVVPAGGSHSHLTPAALRDMPVVLASRPPSGMEADCVLVDDFGGARDATARLLAAGHRLIGFLGNPPAIHTGAERYRGYRAAHEAAGLEPDDGLVRRGLTDVATAERAARGLLAPGSAPGSGTAPTALFCTNNRLTQGAIRAVRALELPVALAGFDDFDLADVLGMPLTIVSYDADEMGRQAARLLIDRINGGPAASWPPRRTVLPTHVIRYGPE